MTLSGWLFDAYPIKDRMIFWIKDENGRSINRLEDAWTPSIYVGSDSKTELKILAENRAVQHYIKRYDFVSRYERIRDSSTLVYVNGSRKHVANYEGWYDLELKIYNELVTDSAESRC